MSKFAKREFSPERRDALAERGAAMPDGSFPIVNVSDLHNAISAYGRAKNQAAAKKHIISRARALGAVDQLPEKWNVTQEVTKASELSNALGIANEPAHLDEGHTESVDKMHDDVEETKKDQQAKNNYVASTHLTTAQRHLKDAKSYLQAKALNADTKHVLAKAALGKASESLTHATREASAPDKNRIHSHNLELRGLISNPPTKFSKMNENHDEAGRFTSGDGNSSSSKPSSVVTNANVKSIREHMSHVNDSYKSAYLDAKNSGASGADLADLSSVHEDAMNRMADAMGALKAGNGEEARSLLSDAASVLGEHSAFKDNVGVTRALASGVGEKASFESIDPSKGQSGADMVSRAAQMYGEGSKQHQDAINRAGKMGKSLSFNLEEIDFKKYKSDPELPAPSPKELADVAECVAEITELRQEAAMALAVETDSDKAKELSEIIGDLNGKIMYLHQGDYTWAKHTSHTIGQALMAGLPESTIEALKNLRTKLHALDHTYPNH